MLGSDVVTAIRKRGWGVTAFSSSDLDLTDDRAIYNCEALVSHDVVVNCAAYTAVDAAESDDHNADLLNAYAPLALASALSISTTRLVHISTDFVFDGLKGSAYVESDETSPLGVYGRSKRDGEEYVLHADPRAMVVRTSWLYGPNGKSFPKTLINAWEAGKTLRVVGDQLGNPTYTADLARVILDMIAANLDGGIYHAAGPETMSWRELADRAITQWRLPGDMRPIEVAGIRTDEWPTPAKRPVNSALSFETLELLGVSPMRSVDESLREFAFRLRNLES